MAIDLKHPKRAELRAVAVADRLASARTERDLRAARHQAELEDTFAPIREIALMLFEGGATVSGAIQSGDSVGVYKPQLFPETGLTSLEFRIGFDDVSLAAQENGQISVDKVSHERDILGEVPNYMWVLGDPYRSHRTGPTSLSRDDAVQWLLQVLTRKVSELPESLTDPVAIELRRRVANYNEWQARMTELEEQAPDFFAPFAQMIREDRESGLVVDTDSVVDELGNSFLGTTHPVGEHDQPGKRYHIEYVGTQSAHVRADVVDGKLRFRCSLEDRKGSSSATVWQTYDTAEQAHDWFLETIEPFLVRETPESSQPEVPAGPEAPAGSGGLRGVGQRMWERVTSGAGAEIGV